MTRALCRDVMEAKKQRRLHCICLAKHNTAYIHICIAAAALVALTG